ncbi:MAG TPA: hypothetical protein VFL72_05880, partial [Acidimicrobiia bacterium]|nr:hypothetical protein [Acidimicrobiia bacterium]
MRRSPSQVIGAAFTGGLIGALGGAALGAASGNARPGAIVGALVLGLLSAWADATRRPGKPQPLTVRIASAAFLAAGFGWLLESALPEWPGWVPGLLMGAATGLAGFRPLKVVLGALVGAVVGVGLPLISPDVGWPEICAVTVISYRGLAAYLWRGREQVQVMGERAASVDLPFIVPFSEATKHVGVDYLERYARSVGASYTHSPPDIGIVADFDELGGPSFDPGRVDPLIREFYEHTSRFTLSIVPEWKPWMRVPYRIYRETVAKPLGQANAPFEIDEVQRGVISWIDTIDVDQDGRADFRAWVRAYENGEPLYVGIYTVVRIEDVAYVAVGFPLPAGNFTATLQPFNNRGDGLLLRSHTDLPLPGHYLSFIEEGGLLTTLQLRAFGEEIDVFLEDGRFRTEHRFSLGKVTFLTL